MFGKVKDTAIWAFDWYARADLLWKILVGLGLGAVMTGGPIGTFLAAVNRGTDPLLAIFMGLLAFLLIGVCVLMALEISRRLPRKTAHSTNAGLILRQDKGGAFDQNTIEIEGHEIGADVGGSGSATRNEISIKNRDSRK